MVISLLAHQLQDLSLDRHQRDGTGVKLSAFAPSAAIYHREICPDENFINVPIPGQNKQKIRKISRTQNAARRNQFSVLSHKNIVFF